MNLQPFVFPKAQNKTLFIAASGEGATCKKSFIVIKLNEFAKSWWLNTTDVSAFNLQLKSSALDRVQLTRKDKIRAKQLQNCNFCGRAAKNGNSLAIHTRSKLLHPAVCVNFLPKGNIFAKFPADALPQSADQLTAELQKAAHALTFSSNMKYLHFDIWN